MESDIEKLHGQLQSFATVVLITQGEHAHEHARPMAVARLDENCDLWFFTSNQSIKVKEIEANTRAQVICQSGWNSCVILAGRLVIVRDRTKTRELWRPAFGVWFPDCADDPNLVLIRFIGEQAEYWDNTGAKRITYLHQSIEAVLPKDDAGDQGRRATRQVDVCHGEIRGQEIQTPARTP